MQYFCSDVPQRKDIDTYNITVDINDQNEAQH